MVPTESQTMPPITMRSPSSNDEQRPSLYRSCKIINKPVRRRSALTRKGLSSPMKDKNLHKSCAERGAQLETISLRGSIPDVVNWVREAMDVRSTCGETRGDESMSGCCQAISARDFARTMSSSYNFEINIAGTIWKGDVRMWENVCAWAARLPSEGRANCVLEAMRRYPCSGLVYYGLKTVFGKSMKIGHKRIPRMPLSQDAIALFSPFSTRKRSVKEWFESNAHVRMQETVVHMCAVSEYILRCALISQQKEGSTGAIFTCMEERIKPEFDRRKQENLRFRPWNILDELSDEDASSCLRHAMWIGHTATVEGAKAARRKYARKKINGKQREKLKLWMLSRPLPEVMDSVIRQLESIIKETIGIELDVDEFRLHMTRLFRKVEAIYESVGLLELSEEIEARTPEDLRDRNIDLPLSEPYTFVYSRS